LVHDAFGRLVAVQERLNDGTFAATSYAYDANDNLTRSVNADGIVTEIQSDFVGQREKITRGGRVWTYVYDLSGNLVAKTLPYPDGAHVDHYTTRMTYDDLDRLVTHRPAPLDFPPEEWTALGLGNMTYHYDTEPNGIGRLSRMAFPFGFIAYVYDARGNIFEETRHFNLSSAGVPISDTRTTRRAYNALGLVTNVWHADGPTTAASTWTTTFYDKRAFPERVVWHTGTEDITLAAYTRNIAGRVTRQDSPMQTRLWAYDLLGRVNQHQLLVSDGSPPPTVLSQNFRYENLDELQEVTTFVEGIGPRTMHLEYDTQHQLRQVTDDRGYKAQFTYTPGGRLKNAVVAADPSAYQVQPRAVFYDYSSPSDAERLDALVNQVDSTPYATYEYDLAGNVVRRRQFVDGGPPKAWHFTYDGDQTQVRVVNPDGHTEIYYNAQAGERMLALKRDAAGNPERLRFWFGDTEIWYPVAGGETKTWTHVALGQPVARIENRTQVEYSHHSPLGHLLLAVDSDGQLKTAYTYGPFGEVLDARGSTDDHLRRFNGEEYDELSGLLYYGFRYYDPLSLTWTQADPLSRFAPDLAYDEPRRMGLYTLSLNNPLRYVDPNGLQDEPTPPPDAGVPDDPDCPGGICDAGVVEPTEDLPLCGDITGSQECLPNEKWATWCEANPDQCKESYQWFTEGLKTAAWVTLWIAAPKAAFFLSVSTAQNEGEAGSAVVAGVGVGGLRSRVFSPQAIARREAVAEANVAQGIRPRPGAAGALHAKGQTFRAPSGGARTVRSEVQDVLDDIPVAKRSDFHGRCAEPACISKALDAGVDPRGGTIATVKVRAPGNPAHGTPITPCPSCKVLLEVFGIKW
jgi:RHS repeat-associated protein